jgi:hypothetical protein
MGGGSALLGGYGRERRDELVDVLAAAIWALDLCFVDVRDVMLLAKFLVAVCTMESVLRHKVRLRANIIAPGHVDEAEIEGTTHIFQQLLGSSACGWFHKDNQLRFALIGGEELAGNELKSSWNSWVWRASAAAHC